MQKTDTTPYDRLTDVGLSALLVLQSITLFVVIPFFNTSRLGRVSLDVCHLSFAVVCVILLTRHLLVRAGLLLALLALVTGPSLARYAGANLATTPATQHEAIALAAFAFNGGVTAVVARHVFATSRVTVHKVRGAILLYLNVAALFAIAYGAVSMYVEGAFSAAAPGGPAGLGTAAFSYFSLATITTTGYGDIVPVHPLARTLANAEAVFGQLFPATLLARLVSLHLLHERENGKERGQ